MEDKKHDKYIIDELLPRYFEGNVSEEEYHIVKKWIEQSEKHLSTARQINAFNLATETLHLKKKIHSERALFNVNKRIDKKRNIHWLRYAQRTAAILFIPLFALYVFLYFHTGKPSQTGLLLVKTNPGMTTRLILPDSSAVYLNSESTLQYPSSFDSETRLVLLDGEAFFEIKPNKKQQFIVSTLSDAKIEVVGTKFNVDAYNNKPFVSVTLVEGVVNFLFNENSQDKRLTMQAGQKTVYDKSSAKTKLYRTSGKPETAWKDGKIIFEKTSFEEALQMLEKRFHVEFIIKDSRFKDDFFSGEFTTQRLDRILEHFKLSSNIHWRYLETDREKEEKTKIEIY